MEYNYATFCNNDPLFYDAPTHHSAGTSDFAVAQKPIPVEWERFEFIDWLVYRPGDWRLPSQGWKIHVSGCLDNAEEILARVWDYCIPRRIVFKFIRNARMLLLRNAKSANRFASGKLITIYPADESQLQTVLAELGAILAGYAGPYILSDLRWAEGPLYVRYGGFMFRPHLTPGGDLQAGIEDANGQTVPDAREAPFAIPPWLTLPEFLGPHLLARSRTTTQDLPYDIRKALHFSNAGGVYLGVDRRTGEQVVIKEARPHAGLTLDGEDAVARLRREKETLQCLTDLDVVPQVRGDFNFGEHYFLVMDYVEGSTLSSLFVSKYPLSQRDCDEASIASYTTWARAVCEAVERAVHAVHQRGIVIEDLHPSNILVRPDGRVVLIDWEMSTRVSEPRPATLGAIGFIAPPGKTGIEIDEHALACLRLHVFLPLTTLIQLDDCKAEELGAEIHATFPVPPAFISEAVRTIRGPESLALPKRRSPSIPCHPSGWQEARDAMTRAILASATPERRDRLFPGDIAQFAPGGGINLAFGAAGVLYALQATGAGRHPEHEEWLLHHALQSKVDIPLGLFDGLHGVAHVLDCLGRRNDALNVLDICVTRLGRSWDEHRLSLFGGLAGIGLNLAYFGTVIEDALLLELARDIAEFIAARLGDEQSVATISGGEHPRAGLFLGSSGIALLFLRLHEMSPDRRLLDLAETALRQDLRRCKLSTDGALHINEGWRTMPYLSDGSVGIGMVLDLLFAHQPREELAESAAAIRMAAEARFYLQPGLSHGLAGMILYLSGSTNPGSAWRNPTVAAQVHRLNRYAVPFGNGCAFPGEKLLRLSMDLTTGTAGVILSLGAVYQDDPVYLPFLGPLAPNRNGDITQ